MFEHEPAFNELDEALLPLESRNCSLRWTPVIMHALNVVHLIDPKTKFS